MQQPISDAQLYKQNSMRGFILFAVAVIAAVLIVSTMLMDGWHSFQALDAAPVAGLHAGGCDAMDKMTFEQLPQNLQRELNGICNQATGLQP